MTRLHHREHGAAHVRLAGRRSSCSAIRSPSRSPSTGSLGHRRHRVRPVPADLLPGPAGPHLRRHEQRDAARDPLLHLHGADPGTLRHGGGSARHDRAALRPGARRPRLAVVVVGALLAATTGVVAASVIAMGLISLPIMLRYGYDRRLATGVIAASGTLAQIIPPSLVLIVMADQLGRSVGDMYQGAIVPGLVLSGLYLAYVVGDRRSSSRTPPRRCPRSSAPSTACSSRSASSSRSSRRWC